MTDFVVVKNKRELDVSLSGNQSYRTHSYFGFSAMWFSDNRKRDQFYFGEHGSLLSDSAQRTLDSFIHSSFI